MLAAQSNGVTVSGLAVDAGTVTFNVSWKNTGMPELWSDTVWVFVDYNDAGTMKRLPLITSGATLTTHTAPGTATVIPVDGNNKGVWVVGNARSSGSFSATVRLLTATATAAGACVYGSNYPPVGRYTAADKITFTGTPPYDIVFHSGGSLSINNTDYTLPSGSALTSFTDKTGMPGIFTCEPPATYTLSGVDVCLNGMVTLTLSGSQSGWKCQLYKGSTAVGSITDGTGSALTFTEAATATGTFNYTVRRVSPAGAQCEMPVSNVQGITVTVNTAPGATVNFTAFNPCPDAATGTTWTLQDTRANGNNQSYKVKKMADGHIWMVQDMKFGACSATGTFYNDNSEAATTHTPTVAPGYVGHCTAATNSDTPPKRGYLYNWPAVMNSRYAYFSSTVTGFQCTGVGGGTGSPNPAACRGICPEGWHIPTGGDNGEFHALHNALVSANKCSSDGCWNASSQWEGVLGGGCNADGLISNQDSNADYWSSTYLDNNFANFLSFGSGTVLPGTRNGSKYFGRTVRCVRNY
jgi:uncharacterized protein (TIGR02145 family)